MADVDNSLPFQVMTQRIIHNADAKFGGACVLVPPGGGKALELLMLDAAEDEGQFWGTILTRIQNAIQDADQRKLQNRGFGAR
jgi:hypothetical protein